MKIIKKYITKITSIVLTLVLLISALSISAFAFKDEFDINDLTWEKIMSMDNDEFRHILAEYERIYDPFDTYETTPIMPENSKKIQNRKYSLFGYREIQMLRKV